MLIKYNLVKNLVAAARMANFKKLKRKQNKDLKMEINNLEVEMGIYLLNFIKLTSKYFFKFFY